MLTLNTENCGRVCVCVHKLKAGFETTGHKKIKKDIPINYILKIANRCVFCFVFRHLMVEKSWWIQLVSWKQAAVKSTLGRKAF